MELLFVILITISISPLLKSAINLLFCPRNPLPPGPRTFPVIGNFLWLRTPFSEIEPILRSLHAKIGPIVTLHFGNRPAIFISDRSIAHQALVQNGAVFADRPIAPLIEKVVSSNQHTINSASYGPTWRVLRRNLMAQILHPSRVKTYSHARKWVLDILIDGLEPNSGSGEPVRVTDHFQYAMFCLLVLMCFGDKLEQKQVKEIEKIHHKFLVSVNRFNVLNFWPGLTKILMGNRWREFYELMKEKENVVLPLIRARKNLKQEKNSKTAGAGGEDYVLSYVDSLLELELPGEDNRKLDEGEIVSLCSEFLNVGTDTTSTALQWIMANLVKHSEIQDKLFAEIKSVVSGDSSGQNSGGLSGKVSPNGSLNFSCDCSGIVTGADNGSGKHSGKVFGKFPGIVSGDISDEGSGDLYGKFSGNGNGSDGCSGEITGEVPEKCSGNVSGSDNGSGEGSGDRYSPDEEIKEEALSKMPYLKAIILEGLRRHPPAHFVLAHTVTEDFNLNGYLLPKNATINFMVAEMGWDPKVWEDPMAFKPERFVNSSTEALDITGTREIKMMPFGVGRRICPAYGLAMLHLEYLVANLIWKFKWKAVDEDQISLEEKQAFTIVMKYPLMTRISPRFEKEIY